MSRTEQLISAYLDGGLQPEEAKELADLLAQDSVARDEFIELYRVHRLLCAEHTAASDSDCVDAVLAALRKERSAAAPEAVSEAGSKDSGTKLNQLASDLSRSLENQARRSRDFWSRLFWPSLAGGFAAAVLVAVIGNLIFFRSGPLSAEITKTSTGVTVIRGERNLAAYEGFQLRKGDVVQTPVNGSAVVQYLGEITTLSLKPGTQLAFNNSKHGKRLDLKTGEIVVVAGKQPTNAPMIVATDVAEARVVGTRFQLAARQSSTWLEVSEGKVAFKRNPETVADRQQPASLPAGPDEVLVKSGEYSVAADGIPLEIYPVTDQLNAAHPLPIKISWFSYYGKPNWYIHPPFVQQTEPATITRTFQLPSVKGGIAVAGTVAVDAVKSGATTADTGAGFGLGLSSGSDYFLARVQRKGGQPVLEIVDLGKVPVANGQPVLDLSDDEMVSLAAIPLSASDWPECQLEIGLERGVNHEAVVRARAWSGAGKPKDWQISAPIKLRDESEIFELRLMTENSACSFKNTTAYLIE